MNIPGVGEVGVEQTTTDVERRAANYVRGFNEMCARVGHHAKSDEAVGGVVIGAAVGSAVNLLVSLFGG